MSDIRIDDCFIPRHIPKTQQNWLSSSAHSSDSVNKTEKTLLQPPLTEPEVHFIHTGLLLCNNRQSRNQSTFKLDALQNEFSNKNNKYRSSTFPAIFPCDGENPCCLFLLFQRDFSAISVFSLVNIMAVLSMYSIATQWRTYSTYALVIFD